MNKHEKYLENLLLLTFFNDFFIRSTIYRQWYNYFVLFYACNYYNIIIIHLLRIYCKKKLFVCQAHSGTAWQSAGKVASLFHVQRQVRGSVSSFTEISSLSWYKIRAAYAWCCYSLFEINVFKMWYENNFQSIIRFLWNCEWTITIIKDSIKKNWYWQYYIQVFLS